MSDESPALRTVTSKPLANQRPVATVAAIFAAVFLLGTGSALQGTVISLRAGVEGFGELTIGLIMSAYYAGFIAGSVIGVRFIRSVGYIRTFAAFASLASATALAHLLLINPVAWVILRAVHGLCTATLLVVVESWLNASSPAKSRGRILSLYSVIYLGSMGVGQPLLSVFPETGAELFILVSIVVSVSLVPIALANTGGAVEIENRPVALIRAFRASTFASIGILVSGISTGSVWSLGPRYAQLSGLSSSEIGFFMLAVSFGALISQTPLGFLSDRVDRRLVVLWSSVVGTAVAVVLVAGGVLPVAALWLLGLLFGAFTMPLYSICLAYANDQLEQTEMVAAAGAYIIFYAVGSSLGPAVSGWFIQTLGHAGLFTFMALAHGVFAVWSLYRLVIRPAVPMLRKVRFHPYPRTTAAAFGLMRKPRRRGSMSRRSNPAARSAPAGQEINSSGYSSQLSTHGVSEGSYAPKISLSPSQWGPPNALGPTLNSFLYPSSRLPGAKQRRRDRWTSV